MLYSQGDTKFLIPSTSTSCVLGLKMWHKMPGLNGPEDRIQEFICSVYQLSSITNFCNTYSLSKLVSLRNGLVWTVCLCLLETNLYQRKWESNPRSIITVKNLLFFWIEDVYKSHDNYRRFLLCPQIYLLINIQIFSSIYTQCEYEWTLRMIKDICTVFHESTISGCMF